MSRNDEHLQISITIDLPSSSSSISYIYFQHHQHHCNYYYYIQPNFYFLSPVKSTIDQEHCSGRRCSSIQRWTSLSWISLHSPHCWTLKMLLYLLWGEFASHLTHGENDSGAEWKAWGKQHLGCRRNKKQLIKGNSKRVVWVWKRKVKASIIKMKPTEALSQQSLVSCIQYLVFILCIKALPGVLQDIPNTLLLLWGDNERQH